MSSQALNMGCASVSELRKRRIMRQRKEKALRPQPALLSIDIPETLVDTHKGFVLNYVKKDEGDFCYCPDCKMLFLVKENECPICGRDESGDGLILEFACEWEHLNIDFMRATSDELRKMGYVVLDIGVDFNYKGRTIYVCRIIKELGTLFAVLVDSETGESIKVGLQNVLDFLAENS